MDPWVFWLVLAMLLGATEIATLTASLGLLGGAAAVTAAAAALGAAGAGAAAGVRRGRGGRHLARAARGAAAPARRTGAECGVDALVGRTAQAVREVSSQGGTVRIDGEEWTARAYDQTL